MSESLLRFLQHLREFGLVYQRKVITLVIHSFFKSLIFKISDQRKAGRFYPTRLALDIASGPKKSMLNSMTQSSNPSAGYIVVETNYRVYAYTDSGLQVALIALFCELIYRLILSVI